jgi:hypothetical protein
MHTTTNQKQVDVVEKRRERRQDRRGVEGGYIHRFGGERVGSVTNNKIKLSSSQINYFSAL